MVAYQRGGRTKTGAKLIFNNGKIAISNSSTSIVPENDERKYLAVVNDSDEAVYLGLSAEAVINEGIRLNNGGGTYELIGPDIHTAAINGISASGSKNVTFVEGE